MMEIMRMDGGYVGPFTPREMSYYRAKGSFDAPQRNYPDIPSEKPSKDNPPVKSSQKPSDIPPVKSSQKPSIAAIAGGTVGGIIGFILLCILFYSLYRRNKMS